MGAVGSREATSMKCVDDTWHSEPGQPGIREFADDPMMSELLSGAAKDGGAKMSDVVCGPSPMENQPIPR